MITLTLSLLLAFFWIYAGIHYTYCEYKHRKKSKKLRQQAFEAINLAPRERLKILVKEHNRIVKTSNNDGIQIKSVGSDIRLKLTNESTLIKLRESIIKVLDFIQVLRKLNLYSIILGGEISNVIKRVIWQNVTTSCW